VAFTPISDPVSKPEGIIEPLESPVNAISKTVGSWLRSGQRQLIAQHINGSSQGVGAGEKPQQGKQVQDVLRSV
jgi:hypothetical protein